jgi:hypothetical protein
MMPMFYQCLSIFAKVFDHHANMSDNGGMVDIKKLKIKNILFYLINFADFAHHLQWI